MEVHLCFNGPPAGKPIATTTILPFFLISHTISAT